MWSQVYDPFNNPWLSTAAAAIPIVVLLGAIAIFEVKAHRAAILGLASALAIAIFASGMPAPMAGLAAVYGAGFGLLPIGWLVLNIIFLSRELRQKFLSADVGVSGANFLIADTGAVCTLTNEGNAELTTTPPRLHIVTTGIEKLVPSIEHAFVLLRLLVRSATGGDITQYSTFHCGPKRSGDADGPKEFHIVLVDSGRTRMLAQGLGAMLRCIRCGACMNHCVVYRAIGGHAYGGAYPGPMGSVLTPVFDGLANSHDLPQACTLNGRCAEVCPVEIPLPSLLRGWRDQSWREGYEPVVVKVGLGGWALVARHSALYRLATAVAVRWMRLFRKGGWIRSMPLAGGWTGHRDFPAPARHTFTQAYKAQRGRQK